ncbi:class C sortase [Brevibacterium linens]|uniref:Sortase A n=2 Tax=Brevibacterium linens TaxID=1703 RepID=A0A2H1I7U9_BRELN|nr:class C sortase [Brevibacterium linens]AZU02113.1 class C sortase [Brevibacterium linens]KAB1948158.1 class C sortase [Brevibacterium linens ATCC 9172]SMX71210.1 sortase A [Brevibacterium linens]SMX84914.1 sortase A [Brevibacterium linens ATCC 9172]
MTHSPVGRQSTQIAVPGTSTRRPSTDGRRWRVPVLSLVIALIALTGLGIWIYPSAAAWFSQLDQSKIVDNAAGVTEGDKAENARQIALAHKYNEALESGAQLESNHRLPSGKGISAAGAPAYEDVLVDGGPGVMTRLRIPSIDVDLPVYHGTDDATLLKGLGHLEGTSLPVGGEGTHSVITGHRGLAEATMFTNLDKVGKGDRFTLTTFGQVLSYQVIRTQVVDPDETESLGTISDRDLVTLVTCTPLGINSQRILVTAERVYPTPAADQESGLAESDLPGFPWWIVIMAAGLVAAGIYVWWSGRPVRPKGGKPVTDIPAEAAAQFTKTAKPPSGPRH